MFPIFIFLAVLLLFFIKIVANIAITIIIADIIIMLLPDVAQKLKADGKFLASGIIEEREDDIKKAAAASGLKVVSTRHKGGWVAMLMALED